MKARTRSSCVLWIVRHGQSAGNAASEAAATNGDLRINLATRDVDVPLSPLGERQAWALGTFLSHVPEREVPTVAFVSPYRRAQQTMSIAMSSAGITPSVELDERLRERELGWLDGLTKLGVAHELPAEAERRQRIGKLYYRPPGGESWCDVFLRVRSFIDSLRTNVRGNVLIVTHQVVVLAVRYVIEALNEAQILAIASENEVANCSITSYELGADDAFVLRCFNHVAPLAEAGAPVTRRADDPAGPR